MSPHGGSGRPSFWERPSRALPDRKGPTAGEQLGAVWWPTVNAAEGLHQGKGPRMRHSPGPLARTRRLPSRSSPPPLAAQFALRDDLIVPHEIVDGSSPGARISRRLSGWLCRDIAGREWLHGRSDGRGSPRWARERDARARESAAGVRITEAGRKAVKAAIGVPAAASEKDPPAVGRFSCHDSRRHPPTGGCGSRLSTTASASSPARTALG
jgi:hypothetical protein